MNEMWGLVLWVIGVMLLISILVLGLAFLCEIPSKNLFNEKFGTNYGIIEWVFAQSTIKEYIHTGENKTLNVKLEEALCD